MLENITTFGKKFNYFQSRNDCKMESKNNNEKETINRNER